NDALLTTRALHEAGVISPITHLTDGEQAMNYLAGNPPYNRAQHPLPTLILLDIKMPKFTGFDVLAWLHLKPQLVKIPVVVLTGSLHPEDQKQANDLRAVGYEVKPVGFEQIVAIAQS